MRELLQDQFMQDPRTEALIDSLIALKEEYQQKLQGVLVGDPGMESAFHRLIQEFGKLRGADLFFPYLGSGMGKGSFVELLDGSVKLDFITGIGVHGFGHGDQQTTKAALKAALSDTIMQGNLQQNLIGYEFSKLLAEMAGMPHCFLSTSGAMANENAFKIIFQAQYPKTRLLAFDRAFAGRSLLLSQITDTAGYREGLPIKYDIDFIPFFDPLRPKESTEEAVLQLKKHLERYPCQYAACIFELIQGEGGFRVGTREFFEALMPLLKEEKILLYADEVQTFGRLEKPFAYQHYGLEEWIDITTVGKLTQACATLFKSPLKPRPGLLSQTFTASTAQLFAGKEILERLKASHFGPQGRNKQIFSLFFERLTSLKKRYPDLIEGPFGSGAMIAFTPWGGKREDVIHFVKELFKRGLIAFIAGREPLRCRMLPPLLTISDKEIELGMDIVEETLTCKS